VDYANEGFHSFSLFCTLFCIGNTPLDAYDGGTAASWFWSCCKPVVGGLQNAAEGTYHLDFLFINNTGLISFPYVIVPCFPSVHTCTMDAFISFPMAERKTLFSCCLLLILFTLFFLLVFLFFFFWGGGVFFYSTSSTINN